MHARHTSLAVFVFASLDYPDAVDIMGCRIHRDLLTRRLIIGDHVLLLGMWSSIARLRRCGWLVTNMSRLRVSDKRTFEADTDRGRAI
jgi:hypothetical protein